MTSILSYGVEIIQSYAICDYCKQNKDKILYFRTQFDDGTYETIHICMDCLKKINILGDENVRGEE